MRQARHRAIPFDGPLSVDRRIVVQDTNSGVVIDNDMRGLAVSYPDLNGRQITVSETHPEWIDHLKDGRFRGDIGGDFDSTIQIALSPGSELGVETTRNLNGVITIVGYRGTFLPLAPSDTEWPSSLASNDDTLAELGTTAIARCSPTNPTIDLTTSVGELVKEGLPKLVGSAFFKKNASRRERAKAIGDEHLNYQFGYEPLANDIASTANRIVSGDAAIRQYERDAGKLVRRSYEFPVDKASNVIEYDNYAIPWLMHDAAEMYDWSRPWGKVIRTEHSWRKRWFSGAFTYVLPPANAKGTDAMARSVIMAKKSLGLRLTPSAIWNLTPWSWAIDWFTNAGDYLNNLDAWIIDGQVLQYGYIMEHTIHEYTYWFVGAENPLGPHKLRTNQIPPPLTLRTETKIRRKATPYGFGLTWDGLSTFQQSILASLGLSKGFKKNSK